MKFELVLKNYKDRVVRLIVIEQEGEEGMRSVRNIYECDIGSNYASRFFGDIADLLETEGTVTMYNENVDHGRAKRWSAKMAKIIQTLEKEDY